MSLLKIFIVFYIIYIHCIGKKSTAPKLGSAARFLDGPKDLPGPTSYDTI